MKEVIIYNRTSTEEQNPENQLKDCKALAQKLNLNDYEVFEEQKSAFKEEVEREVFNSIFENIRRGKVKALIVWDLDRIYRNRKKLIDFFEVCKTNKCRIYSVRQTFLTEIQDVNLPSGFDFIKEMMINNFIQFLGWIAEDESKKKSERVRAAVRKKDGQTLSYKGNVWGREKISDKTIQMVRGLREQGKSYSQITKEAFYFDKNNNKKFVSKFLINKILVGEYAK